MMKVQLQILWPSFLKRAKVGLYEACALGIIAVATLLRVLLIYYGWPKTDSDESTVGLMALHIAARGEHPIFSYGQGYIGSIEAHIGAALILIFGPSLFTVRLGVVILFTLFLVSMYFLTSVLYTKKLALISLLFLSLGSSSVLNKQVEAVGGRPENLLFGAMMFLLAFWLALSSRQELPAGMRALRFFTYAILGLIIGAAIWSDFLILPFVMMISILLIVFCWREILSWAPLCLLVGFIIGAFPLIYFNSTVPFDQNSWSTYQHLHSYGTNEVTLYYKDPLAQEIKSAVLVTLPTATGAYPLCPVSSHTLSGHPLHDFRCTIIHASWGGGLIVLWFTAVLISVIYLCKRWYSARTSQKFFEERAIVVKHYTRLALLGSVGITFVLYAISPAAAMWPVTSYRYLTLLLIATPAIIWPLWATLSTIKLIPIRLVTALPVLCGSVLLLVGFVSLLGTIATFGEIPATQVANQQQEAFIQNLLRIHARHIYSEYWTCNRIILMSNEQIICNTLDPQLKPYWDRYPPYVPIVKNDPHPAYVFPLNSQQALAFAQKAVKEKNRYQRQEFDGYVIYSTR